MTSKLTPLTDGLCAREAFNATLAFLSETRAPGGGPATFLLDEVLELRTFESFPGLRGVLRDFLLALGRSSNRFVLTTRYVTRAHRLLRDASAQFEVIHLLPLSPGEVTTALSTHGFRTAADLDELGRTVHALADGRPVYVRALGDAMLAMAQREGADPVSALVAQMAVGAPLSTMCRFCYELRLHRARGYGALKANPPDPLARGTTDAHVDRAPTAPHTGIHEGLFVLAGGHRPGGCAPETLPLH